MEMVTASIDGPISSNILRKSANFLASGYFPAFLAIMRESNCPVVFDGTHYQKTAEAWLENMDRNENAVRTIFAATYGHDQVTRFFSYWRIFFMSCAEVWGYRSGSEWLVSHYRFQKPVPS